MIKKTLSCVFSILFLLSSETGFCDRVTVHNEPAIQRSKDPDINFDSIESFATVPTLQGLKANETTKLIEKQLLTMLRNQLELMGYIYEDDSSKADILIMIAFSQTCAEGNVKPSLNDVGEKLFGWMNSKQPSSEDQTLQRSYDIFSNTKHVGYCYPSMAIKVFDSRYETIAWTAIGNTTTNTDDIRLSGQVFLVQLLAGFPEKSNTPNPEWYRMGFSMVIRMEDGLNFVPTVIQTWKGSPAQKVGLQKFDQIKSINGSNVQNKSASQVRSILMALSENECELVIIRNGKEMVKKIKPLKMPSDTKS